MKNYSLPMVEIFKMPVEDVIATSDGLNSLQDLAGVLQDSNQTNWDDGILS